MEPQTPSNDIHTSLHHLQEQVQALVTFYQQGEEYHYPVYTYWDAKDVLGHLTFWHESFARNLSDLANDQKPTPLRGKLSEVNARSVATTREATIELLLQRLQTAQQTIERYIFEESIGLIPYKQGSRPYERQEHLDVVAGHIKRHLKDLRKKQKSNEH